MWLKIVFFHLFLFSCLFAKVVVPAQMDYCGHHLVFSQAARTQVQKYVDKITQNDFYFYKMVEKASMYMPVIEDALKYMGVPEDIKYIVIQESGLRGDAVSSSYAVGFWQFKSFTAEEVGLSINNQVDERKHLYRSTVGASRYFYKQYQRYKNWVYAVTAYYTGTTGALPYVKQEYVGNPEMYITEDVHWYALKAIAHKIAYQNFILQAEKPTVWLKPFSTEGEISVQSLAARHEMSVSEFRYHNPWALGNSLPAKSISYYVPVNHLPFEYVADPFQKSFSGPILALKKNDYINSEPMAFEPRRNLKDKPTIDTIVYEYKPVEYKSFKPNNVYEIQYEKPVHSVQEVETDPWFQKDFTIADTVAEWSYFANIFGCKVEKLKTWNQTTDEQTKLGQIIYLVPPKKSHVHVSKKLENIYDIAMFHNLPVEKLIMYNQLKTDSLQIFENQRIYLKEARPSGEKPIIYQISKRYVKNNVLEHFVAEGESLFSISRLYQVTVSDLQNWNQLSQQTVKQGQKLKIYLKN